MIVTEFEFLRWAMLRIEEWDHEGLVDHRNRPNLSDPDGCVGCFALSTVRTTIEDRKRIMEENK